jgi:hypothetical protein
MALGLLVALPEPADARLGEVYTRFGRSELLQGDRLFRYEGRLGARFRFGPARGCSLGNPLMLIDVQDGIIVQQLLVLPLPRRERDAPALERLVVIFLQDAGLGGDDLREAVRAFSQTSRTGKGTRKPLGPEGRFVLDTLANPSLGQIVLAVGFRPTALAPGAEREQAG